jgi:chromosome segregation ATPase
MSDYKQTRDAAGRVTSQYDKMLRNLDDDDLVKRLRDLGDHASFEPHLHHTAADRIEELEAQIKEEALQYLSDTGQMGEAVDDLTRRHQHALHKIDVLEDRIEELEALYEAAKHDAQEAEAYAEALEAKLYDIAQEELSSNP